MWRQNNKRICICKVLSMIKTRNSFKNNLLIQVSKLNERNRLKKTLLRKTPKAIKEILINIVLRRRKRLFNY